MGCGPSGQVHAVAPQPAPNEPELQARQLQEEVTPRPQQPKLEQKSEAPPSEVREIRQFPKSRPKVERRQFCFLFGETSEERKIISFNAKQLGFSTVSSRSKVPSPPLKYQPVEVIYEESQQLFSSNLFSSNSHPPYNFMLALWLDTQKIFLCGGVSYDFDNISSEAFLFDSRSEQTIGAKKLGNNLMGTRFEKLPFMHVRRYSHMGAVMSIEGLKYVFVFGGRTEGDQIIPQCEKYSVTERKWKKIAQMVVPRSTGFSLVFKGRIYVFGGYSGKSKRPKKIECYWPDKDYWEILDIKLHRGIETGLLFSTRPNEVMIVGGNLENGSVKATIRINLEDQTYVFDSDMKRERVLQKGIQTDSDIIVFGGDFLDGIELYNVKEKRWRQNNTSYAPHVSPEDINSFSFSAETVVVEHEELQPPKNEQYPDQRVCLFSNDEAPCIVEINLTKSICKKKAVPMTLRLRSYMGTVLVKPGKHFICGGVSQYFEKASRSTYLYYTATNKCVEQTKMLDARYSFGLCLLGDYVYVFGGKRAEDQVLSTCERFSIEGNNWERLPNLDKARHSLLAIAMNEKIYVAGGTNELMCVDQVEMYSCHIAQLRPQAREVCQPGLRPALHPQVGGSPPLLGRNLPVRGVRQLGREHIHSAAAHIGGVGREAGAAGGEAGGGGSGCAGDSVGGRDRAVSGEPDQCVAREAAERAHLDKPDPDERAGSFKVRAELTATFQQYYKVQRSKVEERLNGKQSIINYSHNRVAMLSAAEAPGNGTLSATKENQAEEPKQVSELALLTSKVARFFTGAASEQQQAATWNAPDARARIAELHEELRQSLAEESSEESQQPAQQQLKRGPEPDLSLELLEREVERLQKEKPAGEADLKVQQAQTYMARKRRKAMFKLQERRREQLHAFTVRNIFEAASSSCEYQESNCRKIESVMNRYLHELLEAERRRPRDPVFEFIAEKHGVTFDRHLSCYQESFGYSNELFRKVTKYRCTAEVPPLGYNYSRMRSAYGGVSQQPFFEIQRRDVEIEAQNLETLESYPDGVAAEASKIPDDDVFRMEWIRQTKNIFKISRLGQKLKQERDGILKRLALSTVREVYGRYQKCEKVQKDYVGRAKRLHRETQLYWRKREKELIEVKKKKEKLETQLRKREEEERESILQVRRLQFLLKESDIYAHFMAKKLGIETDPAPEPLAEGPRVEIDEEAAKLNISEMINEQKENLKKYDAPDKEKLDFSSVNQDSFTNLIQAPSAFRGTLKEYQLKGLRWLDNLYEQGINGILADEMGLGKTIQAIALLSHLSEHKKVWGPFLVIAPSSTLFNWQQEIKKFCPSLKALPYWGTLKERKTIRKFFTEKKFTRSPDSPFHIVITSYQLAVSDEKTFHRLNWQYMILDEAQAIKNIGSQRWGILMGFKARNKLLLTGTPIQNTMAELWALLHFIMPKLFDSHELFQEWFSKDIEAHSQDQKALNQHQIQRLHAILKPFMLRRVKKDVEHQIGKKIQHQIVCEMTRRQQHLYDSLKQKLNLKEFFRLFESKMKVENLMNLVMQFRKVCNHPELFERRPARSAFLLQNFYYYTGLQPAKYGDAKDISFSARSPIVLRISKLVYDEIVCEENTAKLSKRCVDIFSNDNISRNLKGRLTAAGDQGESIQPGEPSEGPLSNAFSFISLMDMPVSVVQFASRQDYLYSYIILLHWLQRNRTSRSLSTGQSILCFSQKGSELGCLNYHAMNYSRLQVNIPAAYAPPVDVEIPSIRFTRFYQMERLNSFHSYVLYGRNKSSYEVPFVPSQSQAQGDLFGGVTRFSKFNAIEVVDFASLIADSTKLKELDRILKEKKSKGDRVLIFCQMTKMLDILEDFMNKKKYSFFRLDGSLNIADRRDMVNEFQSNPKIFAFLLSTRAGGLGVTLTAANTVIFYDNDWNPTMDAQATDRAHRIGQRSDVNVYRLITKGTIEQRIVKRAQQKQTVQSTVYEGTFKADVFKPHEIIDLVFDENEIGQDENQKLLNKQKLKEQRHKRMPTFIPGQPGRPRENREPELQKQKQKSAQ